MTRSEVKDDELLHELTRDGYKIIQKRHGFKFGTDAVLLSDFVKLKPRARLIDFGTGTGIIALLCAIHHADVKIDGVEIQPDIAEMAWRSVTMNDLDDRIRIRHGDIREAPKLYGCGKFDAVVCNPPYFNVARAILPESDNKLVSRAQTEISLDDICQSAFLVLKSGGRLSVIYPASHINEMLSAMERHSLSPKRIRCVQATASRPPKLILLDAVKHGGSQLDWQAPLILQNEDGSYTDEWHRIYG